MIKKFYALVTKNCKNLFRNWTSIFLLIIGPLLIVATLIAAFSDMGFHGITIGYVGNSNTMQPIIDQVGYIGEFKQFMVIEECQNQLKTQQVHLCLDVKGTQTTDIDVYFDNTREVISLILLSQLREGISREKDSVLRTQTYSLMDELRDTQNFVKDKQQDINEMITLMESYIVEISETQNGMQGIRNDIDVQINDLVQTRNDVQSIKNGVDAGASQFNYNKNKIVHARNGLYIARNNLVALGQDTTAINQAIYALDDVLNNLNTIQVYVGDTQQKLSETLVKIDRAIVSLRNARRFIDETNSKLENIKASLRIKINDLHNINNQLSERNTVLSRTTNMNVENIINPFTLNMLPLFKGSRRVEGIRERLGLDISNEEALDLVSISSVQTLLPFLISILVCFIAVIISNIIILDEKHSPSFTRNLITPISSVMHIISILFTVLIILLIIIGVILGIGYSIFLLDIGSSLVAVLSVSILLVLIYSLWGMALGNIINSNTTSLLIASFFLIINIFLSGSIFPIERMSRSVMYISSIIPFRDGLSILQQSMFYSVPINNFVPEFIKLGILFGVSVIVLYVSHKVSKTRFKQGV